MRKEIPGPTTNQSDVAESRSCEPHQAATHPVRRRLTDVYCRIWTYEEIVLAVVLYRYAREVGSVDSIYEAAEGASPV